MNKDEFGFVMLAIFIVSGIVAFAVFVYTTKKQTKRELEKMKPKVKRVGV